MTARPWSKTSPDTAWDYLVLGSGMGGMTAAAMLAEQGKRVLVLEQHYVPGGFTHTFRRKAVPRKSSGRSKRQRRPAKYASS